MTIKKIFKNTGYCILRLIVISIVHPIFGTDIQGKENIPKKGSYILVSNHISYLDPVAVHGVSRRQLRFFMAAEYYNDKKWKWFYDFFGCIPLEKGVINAHAINEAIIAISNGDPFVIFPEGRISSTGRIGKWHPGIGLLALSTGVPVIPVIVRGTADVLPMGSRKLHFRPVHVFAGKQLIFNAEKRDSFTRNEIREAAQKVRDSFIALAKEKAVYDEIVGPEAEQERVL